MRTHDSEKRKFAHTHKKKRAYDSHADEYKSHMILKLCAAELCQISPL